MPGAARQFYLLAVTPRIINGEKSWLNGELKSKAGVLLLASAAVLSVDFSVIVRLLFLSNRSERLCSFLKLQSNLERTNAKRNG